MHQCHRGEDPGGRQQAGQQTEQLRDVRHRWAVRERERERSSCFISFSFTGYTSHQSRLLHPQIGDAFHDEHPKASGTNYPQRFQGSFRQTRILQISLQDNGQGIRHGEGGGKTMQNLLSWTIKVVTNIFEDCRGWQNAAWSWGKDYCLGWGGMRRSCLLSVNENLWYFSIIFWLSLFQRFERPV